MKSQRTIRYVVDSRYFDGSCLTTMVDGIHNDYGKHETIEELREKEGNQFLLPVSIERMNILYKRYAQSLRLSFEEITEERYNDLLNCVPPHRMGTGWFYVGEEYSADFHLLCFQLGDKFYAGHRHRRLPPEQIRAQITNHQKTISFRGAIVKDDSYRESHGNNSKAKCTPYNFIDVSGKKHFLRNLFSETNDTFADQNNRSEMAKCLLSLRKHHFKYWTFHGTEDLFEFFKWIQKNKYTIQIGRELFDFNERSFVDFHGGIVECSQTFHYRIYDRELFVLVINLLRAVKKQYAWRREVKTKK